LSVNNNTRDRRISCVPIDADLRVSEACIDSVLSGNESISVAKAGFHACEMQVTFFRASLDLKIKTKRKSDMTLEFTSVKVCGNPQHKNIRVPIQKF
jgi:hypothetical protein